MKDLVVLALTLGFFALAVGYVALCDLIIGPDEVLDDAPVDAEPAADGERTAPAAVTP